MRLPVCGLLCLLGGFLYHLALGYFYTVGNMNPYIISYMGIKSSEAAWFSSTLLALQAVCMPFGAFLANKIGYRLVLIIAMAFSSGGILLTYVTVKHGLGPYIATYCVLNGIGMGIPYSVIFSIASSWFPAHRATVVGIISSGFGLGALVFTPIQTRVINPLNSAADGTKFPSCVEEKIPRAFLVLGGIVLALELIGTILLRQKPEEQVTTICSQQGDETAVSLTNSGERAEANKKTVKSPRSLTVSETLRTVDFYLLWLIVFFDIIPVVLLTSTFKVYGIRSGFDDQFLSAIATTSSAFNCFGRIFWGHMVDRFSSKCPLLSFLTLFAILFVTFPYVAVGVTGKVFYAIWVFGLFFALSAHFVILPGTCTRVFGPANMATIYGLIYFASCPSALITAAVVSQFDIQGKWIPVFTACACSCVISLLMALFIRDRDARCVGFTNRLCAAFCDPLRRSTYRTSEGDGCYEEKAN